MITDAQLAEIDRIREERARIFETMLAGGWSYDSIRHTLRECGSLCPICQHERLHTDCTGCPDC